MSDGKKMTINHSVNPSNMSVPRTPVHEVNAKEIKELKYEI